MNFMKLILAVVILFANGIAQAQTEVDRWNDVTLSAIRTARLTPPLSSRALAMVHVAMFEAANSIDQRYAPYAKYDSKATRDLSMEVAMASAARQILKDIFPLQKYFFERTYDVGTQALKGLPQYAASVDLGQRVAKQLIQDRAVDLEFAKMEEYFQLPAPGRWIPTLPTYESPLFPRWGEVKPFALTNGAMFRLAPPPTLNSAVYRRDLQEVRELGAKNSVLRTAEQTEIARFWADGSGTSTPPGHFNLIARTYIRHQNLDLLDSARAMALFNIAMADAAIACWDSKYAYWMWRPVTAIRDGEGDATWEPLLFTPYFPEYSSGHSTFSAAGATVLEQLFNGGQIPFSIQSEGLPGVTRSFLNVRAAAEEAGRSRIYGGIHFEFSNVAAQHMGNAIGVFVVSNVLQKR
ncbi:MAG TPA: vanadium-dependent haloperoxidase [Pseudobdellovibrionaceae bacterium]|nr:vanadium-dependent haloperoxidase [Pseudobdellovibrionaceae bacterium]